MNKSQERADMKVSSDSKVQDTASKSMQLDSDTQQLLETRAVNRSMEHVGQVEQRILSLLRSEQENREATLRAEWERTTRSITDHVEAAIRKQMETWSETLSKTLQEESSIYRKGIEKSVKQELLQAQERANNIAAEHAVVREKDILRLLRSEQDNREATLRAEWAHMARAITDNVEVMIQEWFENQVADKHLEKSETDALQLLRNEQANNFKNLEESIEFRLATTEERALNRAMDAFASREIAILTLLRSEEETHRATTNAILGNEMVSRGIELNARILSTRGVPHRLSWRESQERNISPLAMNEQLTMNTALIQLKDTHPRAFEFWEERLPANDVAYRDDPEHNCSDINNTVVSAFRDFMAPYLRGRVLDVGCGTVGTPGYLQGYPTNLISGIDPLEPHQPHPFQFARGVAEFLPWQDNVFDSVIIATSLDHVLSIDMTMTEARRVLTKDGTLLLWIGMVPGAPPYRPDDPSMQPIDKYHLFHFDRSWGDKKLEETFDIVECFEFDAVSCFYTLVPKHMPGVS